MNRLKLGVRLESLGLPLRRALAEAARMGVSGVQADAAGDLSPNGLSQSGRREFRNLLRTYNLELTALGCPLRRGLDAAEDQQPRLEHVRKVLTLSADLGPRVVVVQAGQTPEENDDGPRARALAESLTALARHGDHVGAVLALETGLESGAALAAYLKRFDSGSLAANLDPANLLLHGFDPYESARALHGRIAHAHAKDARKSSASRAAQEVPLGHGDIDWMQFLGVLEEAEYRGWLTVERDSGGDRLGDVAAGIAFLRRLGVGAV
jgi:sugar phosphate isomerase/epimerase